MGRRGTAGSVTAAVERGGAGGERRLIVAPDAATRLRVAAELLHGVPRGTEVLVLAPTWEAGDELVRDAALESGALFGVSRLLLGRLAGLLAASALAPAGRVPAGGLSLDAIAARAIHLVRDELRYFGPVARRPGFPRAVARTMQELRMNAVAADALARIAGPGADLALLAERIDRELAAAGLADRAAVFEAAIAAVGADPAPPWVGRPLVLYDVPLVTGREVALVQALAARAPVVLATAPAGDDHGIARLAEALGCTAERRAPAGRSSLTALQTHLFEDSTPAAHDLDDSVAVQCWPGEARECVEIARAIQREAARGVPFDRMAVFLHGADGYQAHLLETLRRAAIPAFFAGGTTRPDATGRALLALLACAADGLSARRFAEYLSLARVPDLEERRARADDPTAWWVAPDHELAPPTPQEQAPTATDGSPADDAVEPLPRDPDTATVVGATVRAPWRWEQLLVDAAVIGGADRWERRLAGLEEELRARRRELRAEDEARAALADRELVDLGHLRAFALPLIARLAALPARASWGEWLGHLRALAVAALREPEPLLAALAELEPMAPVGPVEIDEVQLVLRARLRELRVPPPRRRYGAVFIAPAAAARGLVFDVVFVPGLAEKIFPRKIVEDPILLDEARATLAAPGLASQPTRVAAERLALRLAVGAARERVRLSYPRIDVEQARPRVPSFYTLEALRAAEGRLPGFEAMAARAHREAGARLGWPAPSDPADAIDDAEYDLALLPRLLEDADATKGAARYLLGANPHLARALRARAYRWLHRWTPADGLVDPDPLATAALARHQLAARTYSPTALQNFASCPYRFFLQAVHRLKPREEPIAIEQIDPLTRGALFHEVQFTTLTRLRAEDALPVAAETLERSLDVVDGALDETAARWRDKLWPAIPRVWEDGIDGIRADLHEWLRREAAAQTGWVPYRFELSFGLAGGERSAADPASIPEGVPVGAGCTLRGSIDLVERHRERGTVRVTDHKTGKVRAGQGVVVGGGEILQPVLYALACERMLPEGVEAGRLYYCTAAGGYEDRTVVLDATSRDLAGRVLGIIDRALATGFLPAAPGTRTCRWCDYRPVCGPYEEERVLRKPAHRLVDLTTLRELP